MDASSSSSASVPLPKRPYSEPMLLTSLPEDVLMRITQRVSATGCYDEIASLQSVSRQFRRLSNEPMVLRSISNFVIQCSIWSSSPAMRMKLQACIQSGHPEALFAQGNADFFFNQKREAGLEHLLESAMLGHQKAIYLYGILMLCLGGPDKQKGMKMLSTLMDPLQVSRSMDITGKLRKETANRFWRDSYGAETMRELKQMYVRDSCRCSGKTTTYVEMISWHRADTDIPASEACVTCFWHNQVHRFFRGYD